MTPAAAAIMTLYETGNYEDIRDAVIAYLGEDYTPSNLMALLHQLPADGWSRLDG